MKDNEIKIVISNDNAKIKAPMIIIKYNKKLKKED